MRTALLLHGLTNGPTSMWRFQEWLEADRWRVTSRALIGHGGRGEAPSYRLDAFADDVLALGDFDLVLGHSLGGATLAVASARRPEWAQRLVAVDPAWFVPETAAARARADFLADVQNSLEDLVALHPEWHPFDNQTKYFEARRCAPRAVTGPFDDNPAWDVRDQVARLAVPTLLVTGDPDLGAVTPAAVAEALASANANIEVRNVVGAGHNIVRDQPTVLRELIFSWLSA
jgi:pimeloyl-ACP methyl ester carboxylesterase